MAENLTVAVCGATGRLGGVICDVVRELSQFTLAAACDSSSSPADTADVDVVVDATNITASQQIVAAALQRNQAVLVATSGWDSARLQKLRQDTAATGSRVLVVPNFSVGSVLGTVLAGIAAPLFETVEIVETHHAQKIDSPSGTAVRTAEFIAEKRDATGAAPGTGVDAAARGVQIAGVPVHSLRQAGVKAVQEVRFGGVGETLEIIHRTDSPDSYRRGIAAALRALPDFRQGELRVGLAEILGIA